MTKHIPLSLMPLYIFSMNIYIHKYVLSDLKYKQYLLKIFIKSLMHVIYNLDQIHLYINIIQKNLKREYLFIFETERKV
jgi:hypothetical protein